MNDNLYKTVLPTHIKHLCDNLTMVALRPRRYLPDAESSFNINKESEYPNYCIRHHFRDCFFFVPPDRINYCNRFNYFVPLSGSTIANVLAISCHCDLE